MSELIYDIAELITKHLLGELSEQESAILERAIVESPRVREAFKQLQDKEFVHSGLRRISNIDSEIAYQRFIAKITPIPNRTITHRAHFLKTTWFRYAAAIIILVTGAAIWYAQYNHSKSFNPLNHSSRQIATIAPSHDKAILTLANGQQIILDSAQGNIVKQGGLTVVNLLGKLKYEGAGTTTEYNTISTPKGGQYQIMLSDGSKVWLNAASSIKFPTAFKRNERNVEITGEAYMEIAKHPEQSFIVKTNGTEIQVLGTSFNVNAYEDEPAVKTTLVSGSIKLSSYPASKAVLLKPGQQATVNRTSQNPGNDLKAPEILIQTADTEQALAWKNGSFQFNNTNLEEIMRQIARWYDIEVVYEKGVPDIKLWGKIKRSLTLPHMLDGLGELGVKFRMEGRRMIVLR